jgi:hypothetical protein
LLHWGLIGVDFGFINLSNAFLDRLRVPKYHFKVPNKHRYLPTDFFVDPIFFAKRVQKKIFAGYRPLLTDRVSRNVLLVKPKKEKNVLVEDMVPSELFFNFLKCGYERINSPVGTEKTMPRSQ